MAAVVTLASSDHGTMLHAEPKAGQYNGIGLPRLRVRALAALHARRSYGGPPRANLRIQ